MSKKDEQASEAPVESPRPSAPQVSAREMYEQMREEHKTREAAGAYGGLSGGAHLQRDSAPGAVQHHANPSTYANLENGYTPVAPGQSRTSGPASYEDASHPVGRVNDPYGMDNRPPDAWQIAEMIAAAEDEPTAPRRAYFHDPLADQPKPAAAPNPAPVPAPMAAPAAPAPTPVPTLPTLPPTGPPVPAPQPPKPTITPGWYPVEGGLRWHDGTEWTEHTHALPPPPS